MAALRANGDSSQRRRYAFGPAQTDLFLTYGSGRWKLWSAREAAVKLSHSDSAETYTAACWGWGLSVAPGSAESPSEEQSAGGIIALGCASGRVQVWDPHSGELVGPAASAFHAIQKGVDCAVSALAPARPVRQSIFVGALGVPEILEIGALDGVTRSRFKADATGNCQLATTTFGDEWLLTMGMAGSAMKLWSVADLNAASSPPKPRARLTGPAEPVRCVDVVGTTGRALALSCDWTANVDVFWVDADTSSSKSSKAEAKTNRQADLVLSSHESVMSARFVRPDAQEQKPRISVVGYGAGGISLWRFKIGSSEKTRSKATAPILVVASDQLGGRIISALHVSSAVLRVAYGAGTQPTFAEIHLPAKAGSYAAEEISIVQLAGTAGEAQSSRPPLEKKPAEKKALAAGVTAPASVAARAAESQIPTSSATVLGPLEAGAGKQRPQKRLAAEDAKLDAEAKRRKLPEGGDKARGLSLAPVVRQALRAKEGSSLESVLQSNDINVIDSTVVELTGMEAFDLLQEVTVRLLKNGNSQKYCSWARQILSRHCSFIGSQPTLRKALEPLHDALQARTTQFLPLVRLRGRIGMLRSLAAQCESTKKEESETIRSALLEYVEGDEDVVPDDDDEEDAEDEDDDDDIGSGLEDLDIFDDDDDDF